MIIPRARTKQELEFFSGVENRGKGFDMESVFPPFVILHGVV